LVPLPATAQRSTDHVDIGTRVSRGDALLTSLSGASFIPLAPADGKVVAATQVQLLNGRSATALEIEVEDSRSPVAASATPQAAPVELTEFIERLRRCGVWTDRHTSPDLLAQLHDIVKKPIDTLVLNLLDVDGGSSLHRRLVRESGAEIVSGALLLAKATGANRVWVAVSPRLADRMNVFVRKANAGGRLKVAPLANDYPQADPTLLLYTLLGRRLRPGRMPTDVGAMLIDGPAATAVGRAIEAGELMLTVPIEIRDSAHSRSHFAIAPIGTPLRHVLEALGLTDAYTLRGGAALRDVRISADAVAAGAELSIDAGRVSPPMNPDPCIRCGWCVEACPVQIHPAALLEAAQDNDMAMAEHHGLHACVECGICSYVCPSRLPLLTAIRELRQRT
jgi:electron transport complex protein RnfC